MFKETLERALSHQTAEDPWPELLDEKMERVVAHRYEPSDDGPCEWISVPGIVKMQDEPFTKGAMRNCYKLKKIAQVPHHEAMCPSIDWSKASNYVAKRFIKDDASSDINSKTSQFRDVEMQYHAKSFAAHYNALADCPRKIDFINTFIIEFIDRTDAPSFYSIERFVDGEYIKHNTNSGFVDTDMGRLTPQTFSHYTHFSSKGRRMIVDIQGVDDLYTDPQIHTLEKRYGDADLGARGMALFFQTHECNDLCRLLKIPQFPDFRGNSSDSGFFDYALLKCDLKKTHAYADVHLEFVKIYRGMDGNELENVQQPNDKEASALFHLLHAIINGSKVSTLAFAKLLSGEYIAPSICGGSNELFSKDLLSSELLPSHFEKEYTDCIWERAESLNILYAILKGANKSFDNGLIKEAKTLVQTAMDGAAKMERYKALFVYGKCLKALGDVDAAGDVFAECIEGAIAADDMEVSCKCQKMMSC